jgi:hypothetical protein
VDSTYTVGMYSSIALDSNNIPHISYYDDYYDNLKYAKAINQPPTVQITSPSPGTVSGDILIQGIASDSDGTVIQVEVKIDGGSWWTTAGTTSWSTNWDTTTVSEGSHTIFAQSKDNNGEYSTEDSVIVIVNNDNQIPNKPIINGPPHGNAGTSYNFTFTSADPDSDDVSYYIKWGDGSITDWTTPQSSGSPGYTEGHTWDDQGTYSIEAKAKDIHDVESDWATLEVVMPVNQQVINPLLQMILERFPNAFPILRQVLGL